MKLVSTRAAYGKPLSYLYSILGTLSNSFIPLDVPRVVVNYKGSLDNSNGYLFATTGFDDNTVQLWRFVHLSTTSYKSI